MRGEFSRAALTALLEYGARMEALIVARRVPGEEARGPLPPRRSLLGPEDAVALATATGLPVFELGPLDHPSALAVLDALAPDLVCVACFPRRLPSAWRERPGLGAVNIHPSLLPAYRGPVPLFWQLRAGERRTGVTVHFVDEGLDTGDVVAQAEMPLAEDMRREEAERQLAAEGARLLADALAHPSLPRRPQGDEGASRQGWPGDADRVIPTSWPARHAFRFIQGAAAFAPFTIDTGEERLAVERALEVLEGDASEPIRREGGRLFVRFTPGVLVVPAR